ncbi:MAG TPA: M56 family metallopeptidase [Pirellulales bacterium]|nr:M56 family metallopeptidase [Pirellulales bacterium]
MSENLWQAVAAWASQPLVEALGGSLMHFLWQGAGVAALLAAALWAIRGRSPKVRYLTACTALAAMAACPTGTFFWLSNVAQSRVVGSALAASPAPPHEMQVVATPRPQGDARLDAPPTPGDRDTSADTPTKQSASISSVVFDPVHVLEPLVPWTVALWLAGVVTLSARLCVGWLGLQRMRRRRVRPVPPGWEERLTKIAGRMRVSRPVRLLESALIEVPTVIGWLRPIVLVPASAWIGLAPRQLEALLAHELAHVRRHDYAVNFMQTVLETLLFYHPAMWWVSSTIRQEREACCDDIAAEFCGDRREYARALASMEALRGRKWRLAVAASGGQLIHRIRRIVGVPAPQSNRSGLWLMAAVAASVFAMVVIDGPRGLQAVGPDDGDKNQIADEEGWGPESRGLRCRVTPIAADADDESPDLMKKIGTFLRGEDLTLAVELKNVSNKTVTLLGGKGNIPFLGPHLFDLEFTHKDGQPIPRAARGVLTSVVMLIESSTHELEPGKTLVVVLRPARFSPPMDYEPPSGDYQVRVRYHVGQPFVEKIATLWPDKLQGTAWAGEAISQAASFTVAEDPQAAKVAELRWGEAKDGLRAAVQFLQGGKRLPSDGSQAVPLNTALDVVFHLQNVGDKSISLMSETWRQLDPVTVKDESGNEQTLTGPWYSGFPIMARWTLKPKETAEIRAYGLGIEAAEGPAAKFEHGIGPRFSATPGKYQFRYKVHVGNSQTSASQEGDWQGELTTGETTLTIRARTPEEDAAERARHFTGRVEFVANDGKAVDAGVFTADTYEASKSIEIHAGPIEIPDVTSPVTITVVAPGYEETSFQGQEFKRDETRRFELRPTEPTRFRLIADGRPVAGAKVRRFNKTSDNASGGPYPLHGLQGSVHAVSAEDGTVVLASLQKVNQGYEDLGAAVYFLYIEAEGFAGRFLGPVRAGTDLGDVALSRPLEVRGEIRGTPEELKNFAADWDQLFELKTANPMAAWSYAVSQRLETKREGDKLTFHLTGLRPGNLRIICNFSPGTHHVRHTYARRDPQESDVVVEADLTKSMDDLVITPAGRKPADAGK